MSREGRWGIIYRRIHNRGKINILKKKKVSKSDKIKIKYINDVAKTRHELGIGAYPRSTNKPLYERRTCGRTKINTL